MASSSSFAEEEELVDPQLQKSAPEEPAAGTAAETTAEIKKNKKKKKVVQVADCDVKYVLSYKPDPVTHLKVPEIVIRKDPILAASWYEMLANMALFDEINDAKMLERQKDYRHQLKTKGRVTYEVEVDDGAVGETAVGSSGVRGRRRNRPGVMRNQDGQTRKLN